MPPIALNRRRFLGCSAAAGLALSQGIVAEASPETPVRVGLIGLGSRGTTLLRGLLELPGVDVVAVADAEPKHVLRASNIAEKAGNRRPDGLDCADRLLERPDVQAVIVAVPCDLHAGLYVRTLAAGKHLYAEKPLGLTLAECDRLVAASAASPQLAAHVGFQRRSNPRFRDGVGRIRRGDIGEPVGASATWVSSNGPVNGHDGWLADRSRSGDWMVEQAVHVWDVLHWVAGGPPSRAFGQGRRDLFRDRQPGRDVTDHYSAQLEWPGGFQAFYVQSWAAPADDRFTGVGLQVMGTEGGLDFGSGALTFRDKGRPRETVQPGVHPDTRLALSAFLAAVRGGPDSPHFAPPVSLREAVDATLTGLLVRKAVDERRLVTTDEVRGSTS